MFEGRYRFEWRKNNCQLVEESNLDKRYRVRIKSVALHQIANWNQENNFVVLKCKKMFLFEEIDRNVEFNSLFLGNS